MNKQEHSHNQKIIKKSTYRRGFALIITLSALSVIIALTAVLVSYLDEARKDSSITKAMIQGNFFYSDIRKIFKNFKNREDIYNILYSSPMPFVLKDGRFSAIIDCKPLANGININWIAFENNEKMSEHYNIALKVFEDISQNYDIENFSMLMDMILEEAKSKGKYVQLEKSRLRQKNGIISSKQFLNILDRYQRETDDTNIAKIPWEKFFVFREVLKNPKKNLIDGNYISAELLCILFDLDLESVKDEWIEGTELKTFISSMGGGVTSKLFDKGFHKESRCDVLYDYEGERFAFYFEDIEKEIKNFEFFGKQ
jgi:hypothetical protein